MQQILFYRELDFSLAKIKAIVDAPDFSQVEALEQQKMLLEKKRTHLDELIVLIDEIVYVKKEGIVMTKERNFEVFKKNLIEENEVQFGEEVRNRFGAQSLIDSNNKLKEMTEKQFAAHQNLEQSMLKRLAEAMEVGDPSSDLAFEVAELHKRWLQFSWKKYTKEAHAGLAMMYVADERFVTYYDSRVGEGATQFLSEIIQHYTK